jgi:hypothetical protein
VTACLEFFENETNRETPLFVGRVVAALARDPDLFEVTGQWLVAAELAARYGITDENGNQPSSTGAATFPPEFVAMIRETFSHVLPPRRMAWTLV